MQRIEGLAQKARLRTISIKGTEFEHRSFVAIQPNDTRLIVLIEGDGSPWIRGGAEIAADPTPREPLMLRLAAEMPGSRIYLGRPCYMLREHDPRCSAELWTGARYSLRVVASMSAAIDRFAAQHGFKDITLLGYSGGGTLAVLIAPRLHAHIKVITIGANLDIAAWTGIHGYLPLDESLNPADEPPLPSSIEELHLYGDRDTNASRDAATRYLNRIDPASVRVMVGYGHVCCWERDWPRIWQDIQR
jgi:pimeloyl-ACP methyl ester carboxylesterase